MSEINIQQVDTVILCGGKGSRLQKVVNDRPKPMAQIAQKPFLDILIEYISSFGFRRFILSSGYMGDYIQDYYLKKEWDYEIIISQENKPLGTAGALKNAESLIQSDIFLALNGDSFCQVNLPEFYTFHKKHYADISVALVPADSVDQYGVVTVDRNCNIESFNEKQKCSNGFINAGIYIFNKSVLSMIPPDKNYSLEKNLFPKLINKNFCGYITENRLYDIGTPERLNIAEEYFSKINKY